MNRRAVMTYDMRKQSLYMPEWMLDEINEEALRQDRSLSWLVQRAWAVARETIKKYPAAPEDRIAPP